MRQFNAKWKKTKKIELKIFKKSTQQRTRGRDFKGVSVQNKVTNKSQRIKAKTVLFQTNNNDIINNKQGRKKSEQQKWAMNLTMMFIRLFCVGRDWLSGAVHEKGDQLHGGSLNY